jgi:hypothetical protein
MIEAVKDRLKAEVSDLGNRVEGAAEFDAVRKRGTPSRTPVAYLLPLGIVARPGDAATGVFTQPYAEALSVILLFSSNDRHGERSLNRMREIIFDVILALVGWAPGDEIGVFQLARGGLIGSGSEASFAYQLDFNIDNQLRVTG